MNASWGLADTVYVPWRFYHCLPGPLRNLRRAKVLMYGSNDNARALHKFDIIPAGSRGRKGAKPSLFSIPTFVYIMRYVVETRSVLLHDEEDTHDCSQ